MLSEFSKKRLHAFFIDVFVISIIHSLMVASYMEVLNNYFNVPSMAFGDHPIMLVKLQLWSFITVFFGYFTCCLYLSDGQTVGKIFFNLKVIGAKKQPLTLKHALARSLAYLGCYMLASIPFILALFHPKRRGIPCFFSGTKVIAIRSDDATKVRITRKQVATGEVKLLLPPPVAKDRSA